MSTVSTKRTKVIDDDKKIISELLVLLKKRSGGFWFGEEWDLIKRARKATRRASDRH
jgi:hypothetical protein